MQPYGENLRNEALAGETVEQLMREFGVDDECVARIAELGGAVHEGAPELASVVRRENLLSNAEDGFRRPLLGPGMTEPQRALLTSIFKGDINRERLRTLLARWVCAIQPDELVDRVRLDCQRLHEVLRIGVMRVFDIDLARCERMLEAIERLSFLQLAVLAALADSGERAPGTRPAPDYAPFMEQLREQIEARRRDGHGMAVLLVDCGIITRLDGLWGYHVGDTARSRIVQRLRMGVLRARDILGELGRDEFACVLSTVSGTGVAQLAAQKVLRMLGTPVSIGETEIYARPAVGVAVYPEHGDNAPSLLLHAKIACQAARETVERIAVYTEQQEGPNVQLMLYESKLRAAIDGGTLELVYQPQFDPQDQRVVGAEGLLRWQDSEFGAVPPHRAIAIAESAGLINEVTWWVLNNALRQCAQFREQGLDLTISVNLSPNNLREPDLPDFIDRGLRTWGVPPDRLVIEITETAVVGAPELVSETLRRLKAIGVRLSIDDFGTGYSSMYYLATMPLDEMKIDLSFVRDMLEVPQHERIVHSMIELAHNLGLTVVAEGVEDAAVWARLAELGCDRIQGFFASPPLLPSDLVQRYGPNAAGGQGAPPPAS